MELCHPTTRSEGRIVQALKDQVFTLVRPLRRLHSDQGRNFESYVLLELCKEFGVTKSHTTPYHPPMGDGLVEHMSRSMLNLLCALVKMESDWEEHVPLLLFVYRTTKYSTPSCHRTRFYLDKILPRFILQHHQLIQFMILTITVVSSNENSWNSRN